MSEQSVGAGYALAAIATSATAGVDPSEEILGLLAGFVSADAATLVDRSSAHSGARVATSFGYPGEILEFLVSRTYSERDPAYLSITTEPESPRVRHWGGMATNYRDSYVAQRHLIPSGFNNGTTALLITSDGHYVGDFHMSTCSSDTPSTRFLEWIDRVSPLIADMTENYALSGLARHGSLYLLRASSSTPRILRASPAVSQAVADRLLRYVMADARFHGRRAGGALQGYWRDPDGVWYSVRAEFSQSGTMVSVAAEAPPYSLTERELQILTGCVDGLTSMAIARQLGLSERTVAHRLEGIYQKLSVGSRASSVVACLELGLRFIDA